MRPTWDIAGQRVERIVKPGEKLGHGLSTDGSKPATSIRMCGCKDCKALYEQLTAA